ncbi:hypothetical protein J4Q44_G00164570 [Coregonus suidteri]|uniref:Uncharacterized protein n=1 Tax=Coregonus suidteri TaxID=861788 RepID=A0AAN8LK66_9TELE
MQQVMKDLKEKLADSESSKEQNDNLSQEHQDQIRQLKRDQLQEILWGVRDERNQLKRDLGENVEMIIENQEELRVALEKIHHQEENIKHMDMPI